MKLHLDGQDKLCLSQGEKDLKKVPGDAARGDLFPDPVDGGMQFSGHHGATQGVGAVATHGGLHTPRPREKSV